MALPAKVVAVFDAEVGVGEAVLCAVTMASIASDSNIHLSIETEEIMMMILCSLACVVCTYWKESEEWEEQRITAIKLKEIVLSTFSLASLCLLCHSSRTEDHSLISNRKQIVLGSLCSSRCHFFVSMRHNSTAIFSALAGQAE